MKRKIIYLLCFFFLLFLPVGKDLLCSYFIQKDFNLENKIITETDYENLKNDYNELLEKMNLWTPLEENTITSKVILHDPYTFFDKITILKGKMDGIEVNDIVMDETSYIGKVKKVNEHSSEVELFTNSNIKLSVRILNSYGILEKEGLDLVVKNITSKEEIKEGEIVYTSKFSDIPLEIPLAKVKKINKTSIEQKLVIEPLIKIEKLNYVLIKKGNSYDN